MATKAEVQAHIAKKLRQVLRDEITGAYVKSAVAGTLDAASWNQIAVWIRNGQEQKVGEYVRDKVVAKIRTDADAEAATALSDNHLSIAQYARAEKLP